MAMEIKHLQTSEADEISRLRAENERLKEMMPKYEQFIKDEKFKKKITDEYDGYVYEWMAHRYIATPYMNVLIKGILRALWLARANNARNSYLKWNLFANFESEDKLFTIDEYDETPGATDGQVLRTYTEWLRIWQNVERKCLKEAEEYK